MEIYIHSHQIIMSQVINSKTLSSSFGSKFGVENLYDCLSEFIKEWDSIIIAYQDRMTVIKLRIHLWQQYLYHICNIDSSLKIMKKEIAQRMLATSKDETLSWILKQQKKLEILSNDIVTLKNVAGELQNALTDPQIEENIQNQVTRLELEIQVLYGILSTRKSELIEIGSSFETLTSNLQSSHDKLFSDQLCSVLSIPSSLDEMKKDLVKAQVKNKEIIENLDKISIQSVHSLQSEGTWIHYTFPEQIISQKNLAKIINIVLEQHVSIIHRNLETLSVFDRKSMHLLKWCEKIEKKIDLEFIELPANAISKVNNIKEEITLIKEQFDEAIALGNSFSSNKEISHTVNAKTSALQSALSRTENLVAERLENLERIMNCFERLNNNSEKLSNFMLTSESSLSSYPQEKVIPYPDVEKQLTTIQVLEVEIKSFEGCSSIIQSLLDELNSDSCSLNSTFKQNVLQYPQYVLRGWTIFKNYITRRKSSLMSQNILWDKFLNDLSKLEKWLMCKENIASRTNYSEPGHSRSAYLEGVGIFEDLNHCFQDDINLLHSVNSSFHKINRKEPNVSSDLKDRVMSASERWHSLYKKVSEVFVVIKNILQTWDTFDELKQHLMLFLTEIDMKLSEMETTTYHDSICENIQEEFKLHEDEKERYNAIAKHLMKQSECSISSLLANVEEVEDYWNLLLKRLQLLRKTVIEPVEEIDSKHISSLLESEVVTLKEMTEKDLERIYSSDYKSQSCSLLSEIELKSEGSNKLDQIKGQLYSQVAATGATKSDGSEVPIVLATTKSTVSDDFKKHKKLSEKQVVLSSAKMKPKSFDEDCIKDLLAALKEAEERMDVLEMVLGELTPSGMDEHEPNYSRLLAACRSSVDVIQHLSQFLFYDVPCESEEHEKAEIRLQSEDLLQRWQKIENIASNKESRILGNRRSWDSFSKDLKDFEAWIQNALQGYSAESHTDADMEKVVNLLQKHKELISQIRAQKKIILMLNLTGQKFLSVSTNSAKSDSLKDRIKTLNDHWDNLYSTALKWQSKLQSEFFQSSEFQSTINEMRLWLEESDKRIDEMSQAQERDEKILHEHHTELFALKQQLEVYSNRLETLLEITLHLFLPELTTDENSSFSEETLIEVQTNLKSNLKMSQSLLIKCTEMLKSVSHLLGFSRFQEQLSHSANEAAVSQMDGAESTKSECCSFLMRVARASFPIQAILLLLLGAAILLPMDDEEEVSCRLSNNFATSLNTMLRYPNGPPPV